jgi:hypothetical protein
MGVMATGPQEYSHILRSRGLAYHPDLVLVSFFIGNDFSDIRLGGSTPTTLASQLVAPVVVKRLLRLSAEWIAQRRQPPAQDSVLPPRLLQLMTSGGPYDDVYHDQPDVPTFSEDAFLEIELERMRVCRSPAPAALQVKVQLALEALNDICALAHGRVLLAIIPDEFQVNRELFDQLLSARDARAEDFDLGLPQRILTDYAHEKGIPCLDLMPALRTGQEKLRRVYQLRDTHWNLRGNRIAAFELSEALARELPRLIKN